MSTYQIRAYLIRGCLRRSDMAYPNNQASARASSFSCPVIGTASFYQ